MKQQGNIGDTLLPGIVIFFPRLPGDVKTQAELKNIDLN